MLQWQGSASHDAFAKQYRAAIREAIEARRRSREPIWTESIAVGSSRFIQRVSRDLKYRSRLKQEEVADEVWTVRETPPSYGSLSEDQD